MLGFFGCRVNRCFALVVIIRCTFLVEKLRNCGSCRRAFRGTNLFAGRSECLGVDFVLVWV